MPKCATISLSTRPAVRQPLPFATDFLPGVLDHLQLSDGQQIFRHARKMVTHGCTSHIAMTRHKGVVNAAMFIGPGIDATLPGLFEHMAAERR